MRRIDLIDSRFNRLMLININVKLKDEMGSFCSV